MRILITGATGFIGSHLVDRLAPEHELYALVRRRPPAPVDQVHYLHQDLATPLMTEQLPTLIDAVIHQAALIHTETAQDDALPFLVNVAATWRLLTYAQSANARIFLHASTGGIYGCCDRPLVEDDPFNPMDLYSLTKSQAELAVRTTDWSFPHVVLRYFFAYGVGTPNPIPSYIARALSGAPIDVTASRRPALNPIHIMDTVEATVRALALRQDETLNIAGAETTTFTAIAEHTAAQAGRVPNLCTIPDAETIAYYRSDLVADITRMQGVLRFRPQVDLHSGLTELTDHFIQHSNNRAMESSQL